MNRVWASRGGFWVALRVQKVTPEYVLLLDSFGGTRRLRRKPLESEGRVRSGTSMPMWFFTDAGKVAEDAATMPANSTAVLKRHLRKAEAEVALHKERVRRREEQLREYRARFAPYVNRTTAARCTAEDVGRLKAAMVAAHPDKGGSHDAFIAARAAYERAVR